MSSLPSEDGVFRLRALVAKHRGLEREVQRLSGEINQRKKRFEEASQELAATKKKVVEQLDSMDCRSNGNNGWEHRITWMLSEMEEQAMQHGEKVGIQNAQQTAGK